MTVAQVWIKQADGSLRCAGRSVGPIVPPPQSFVMDSTRPVAANTGLSVASLQVSDLTLYDGNMTVNTAGTVIEKMLIRGQIKINANNVTVRNCKLVGRTVTTKFASAMIETVGTGTVIENCELTQYDDTLDTPVDNSTYYTGGVQVSGGTCTVTRCDVHDVQDGLTAYNGGVAEFAGNYVHELCFRTDDQAQAKSTPAYWSHNDCIQIGAGVGHYFHGNHLDATFSLLTGMGSQGLGMRNCHGMLLQSNTAVVTGLRIEYNWLAHGNICMTFSSPPPNLSGGTASLLGNRITPNQAIEFGYYKQIGCDPSSAWTLTGMDTTVYSDESDTPSAWRGQPIKASVTSGTNTYWAFNSAAATP